MEANITIGDRQFTVSGDEADANFAAWRAHGSAARERVPYQISIRSGDICCDVGANIGLTALMMASACGPTGMVVGFEASPANFAHLRRTIEVNNLANCQMHNAAVGAAGGTLRMEEDGPYSRAAHSYSTRTVAVPMISIDEWWSANDIGRLAFLKIDVEGYELEVLKGAASTISTQHPRLLIEFNSLTTVTQAKVIPHTLLGAIMDLYPHVAVVDRETGLPAELERTPAARNAFVVKNMASGFVDDLLCWFPDDAPTIPETVPVPVSVPTDSGGRSVMQRAAAKVRRGWSRLLRRVRHPA